MNPLRNRAENEPPLKQNWKWTPSETELKMNPLLGLHIKLIWIKAKARWKLYKSTFDFKEEKYLYKKSKIIKNREQKRSKVLWIRAISGVALRSMDPVFKFALRAVLWVLSVHGISMASAALSGLVQLQLTRIWAQTAQHSRSREKSILVVFKNFKTKKKQLI